MALLKLSGFVDKLSGKLNGYVAGTNANGSYLKSNSYSQQPNTIKQQTSKYLMGLVQQEWRNCSQAQQASWNDAIIDYPYTNRVGDTVYYSGYQLFCFINCNRYLIGLAVVFSPPVYAIPSVGFFDVDGVINSQVNLAWSNLKVTDTVLLYMSKPFLNARAFKNTYLRYIGQFAGTTTSGAHNFFSEYNALFGPFTYDSVVWCRVKVIDRSSGISSGFSSPFLMTFAS